MAANCVYCHRIIKRDTFVAMSNIFINYQHAYVYVDNYQNDIYFAKNEIDRIAN